MKQWIVTAVIVLIAAVGAAPVLAETAAEDRSGWWYDDGVNFHSESGKFTLNIGNRAQVRLQGADFEVGESHQSFDIGQYKIMLSGTLYTNWKFRFQANLANGSERSQQLLEDAYFIYAGKPLAQFWAGQGKVFFSRQDLTPSGSLQFIDRSIATKEFRHNLSDLDNRDVGAALFGQNEKKTYEYYLGLYNGNGINKDQKDNNHFMTLARLVVTPMGDFPLGETDLSRPEDVRLAIGVAAMTLTKGTGPLNEDQRDTTGGLEIALKIRGFNMHGEFYTRSERPPLSAPLNESDTDGWYAQIGWLFKSGFEVVGRYSEIMRDVPDMDDTEYGLAFNHYFKGNKLKLQADVRLLDFEGLQATPRIDRREGRIQVQFEF